MHQQLQWSCLFEVNVSTFLDVLSLNHYGLLHLLSVALDKCQISVILLSDKLHQKEPGSHVE